MVLQRYTLMKWKRAKMTIETHQRIVEYFVVNGKEFDTEAEAKDYVKDNVMETAFEEFKNDMRGYYPYGYANYGYGSKEIYVGDSSLKRWISNNSEGLMQLCKKIGD